MPAGDHFIWCQVILRRAPFDFARYTDGGENRRADRKRTSEIVGERGGTRTLDPMIKSHVLYRLSYALPP